MNISRLHLNPAQMILLGLLLTFMQKVFFLVQFRAEMSV